MRIDQEQLIKDFENLKIQVLLPSARTMSKIAALTLKHTLSAKIIEAEKNGPFLKRLGLR